MREENLKIELSAEEAINILKEIETTLISLHKIGSYYAVNPNNENYEKETTRFIDEWNITSRLAQARKIICSKFDTTLGADDMDDLEREMEKVLAWSKPGDMPK